jgi:hypothetical protein
MKVREAGAWLAAYASVSGALIAVNNLSDLTNKTTARQNLDLEIGVDVQAYDAQLADVAGLSPADNNFIVGNGTNFVAESGSTARSSLGLGSIATQDSSNVTVTGGSVSGITDLAVADGGTGASDASGARTNLGLAIGTNVQAYSAELQGISQGGNIGMKNRIINGAMVIDQRNAGASVTAAGAYTLDRWIAYSSAASKFTVQQNAGSVTPPVGFSNYLGVTSTSAYSVGSTDFFSIEQPIEGFNAADLAWGTANAKSVTLSFWVRSSLTGTFGGAFYAGTGTLGYAFSYSISAANTWEYKTVTIAGPTTGTWASNNAAFGSICFSVGMGSSYSWTPGSWLSQTVRSATGATSVVGTNGATFYITGVQLEVGSTATSFEYRQYTTELQLAQRYCINYRSADAGTFMRYGSGYANSATNLEINVHFPVTMRTNPSLTTTATAANYSIYVAGAQAVCSTLPVIDSGSDNPSVSTVSANSASTFSSSGGGSIISAANTTSYMLFTAEL